MSDGLFNDMPSETLRRVWLASLAKLVKPDRAEATAAGLVGMLPTLAHVDDVAFNADTLREVARKCKSGVPSFGIIEPILVTWQQRNRPRTALLAGLRRYRFNPDPSYRPHPATWLNGERWLDDDGAGGIDPVLAAAGLTAEHFR